ncbi:hypothetical protein GW17_00027960 [Ensete ventricosum]|nr:hypothetical protein GW17_00027960 [Ensete ventricosum]
MDGRGGRRGLAIGSIEINRHEFALMGHPKRTLRDDTRKRVRLPLSGARFGEAMDKVARRSGRQMDQEREREGGKGVARGGRRREGWGGGREEEGRLLRCWGSVGEHA